MIRKFVVTALGFSAALGLGLCAATTVARAGDHSSVLGSVSVQPGEHTGNVSTVNGSVQIGADAVVGNASTVNGGVHIDSGATASDVSSTNGGIDVRDGAHVNGNIHTVNGGVHVDNSVEVTGNVGNVNGGIRVAAAHIHGSISTTNGGIDLGPNAHIDGDVRMEPDHSWHPGDYHPPRVVIEPGTIIKGKLHFERKVTLYVSDRATIGVVEGAQPITFSGDHPPVE
jgi:cytoskeletal protein CcmA (bactofilin family)